MNSDTEIDRMECPFCHEHITTRYYARYRMWSCGCFNEKCQIKPAAQCMDTELGAIAEWISSFKTPKTKNED